MTKTKIDPPTDYAVEMAWKNFCESWPALAETSSARELFLRWIDPIVVERNNYRSHLQQIADMTP